MSPPSAPEEEGEGVVTVAGVVPKSSLGSLLLLPSPHSSLSPVGEEGPEVGGWCFLALRLLSLKLASGGRSLTPLRVEPSMAFCNFHKKKKKRKKRKREGVRSLKDTPPSQRDH